MPLHFLTLYFDAALEEAIRRLCHVIRDVPGASVQEHRPHVTLAAFDVRDSRSLDERLSAFVRGRDPIPIHLHHIGLFPREGVVFVAPRRVRVLLELHRALVAELSSPGDAPAPLENLQVSNWVPHCTIATVDNGQLGSAIQALQASWEPLLGTAEGIGVLVPPETDDRLQLAFQGARS